MSSVVYMAEYAVRLRPPAVPGDRQQARSATTAVERCGTSSPLDQQSLEFCFWQGASGTRYVHHVFTLIECPQLPNAVYLLVGRDENGKRQIHYAGCAEHDAPSLNLAEIRQRGATIGAREVHIHLLGADADHRKAVAEDIRQVIVDGAEMASLTA